MGMSRQNSLKVERQVLLDCQNLSFSYGDKAILSGVSLQFEGGCFVALLGKNGAGKSTLLRCLCGLDSSESDHLSLKGVDLVKMKRAEIARHISFVPQEHDEMFPFSVLDVVVMGRTVFLGVFGRPKQFDYDYASQTLEELGCLYLAERVYTTLSGGEKQLVLLARALVQTREIIFLDEPTNHLDYKNRYHMLLTLKNLCQKHGTCVVACLHDPNHALLFADEVIMLEDGKVMCQGKTAEVVTGKAISRLYGIASSHSSSQGLSTVQPCFSQPAFAGRVLLLVGTSGDGKTTILQRLVAQNRSRRMAGVLCPGSWKDGKRYSSEIVDIQSGESTLFAQRERSAGPDLGSFVFYDEGQALARRALDFSEEDQQECILIDEVGPLELHGGGYAPSIPPLLALTGVRHIWAVRPTIVEQVKSRWMLVEPIIVNASDDGALAQLQKFLETEG
ncbi:related to iron (III) ABC transporter, ATP-binding protein [Desulfotalea psychrophila LSv54]|uniref:Related to iron (III) ABC transporter, ATP-binding protein n=2 Tax=Desulfotalea psychrophila TaxID=84980 RepID=Q6AIX3_DESPS|nr:related to iron (III) ABC transporter, ATP-binding protein [Desulfotalea psychrophila LSv54]